jgi:superfamily II DNA or RNA helicase
MLPKAWFDQFDVVIGDEAHQFKAKSLTSIMEKMTEVKYRIGTTGSLDDKKINRLVLEGIFGAVYRVTTTKKLQDEGKLAGLMITALLLKFDDDTRKAHSKLEYKDEIDFIITSEKRNKFLRNLAINCKGNTLLLFNYVERHGAVLYEMIRAKAGDRNVYFIHGGVDVTERERIRKVLATETDAIVVASYGTLSTGINIPSIENIIFGSPSKSVVRVLQSIGRGLRLNTGKLHCNLFDLTDDLHWKGRQNHTLKHGVDRYKIYSSEEFNIKLVEVNL